MLYFLSNLILPIRPGFSLENRNCTWKRGHGRTKKAFGSVYMGIRGRMYFILFLLIMQTLKFFT